MKIWRFIIVIIALGVVAFMFFYHKDINTDIPDIKTLYELNKDFGKPEGSTTIMLKKGISLYEYQSDLYNYIPDNDSLAVVQSTYRKGSFLTVIKRSLMILLKLFHACRGMRITFNSDL